MTIKEKTEKIKDFIGDTSKMNEDHCPSRAVKVRYNKIGGGKKTVLIEGPKISFRKNTISVGGMGTKSQTLIVALNNDTDRLDIQEHREDKYHGEWVPVGKWTEVKI